MSFRKSIRWRIQAWHGLLLLAMTSGFGTTIYQLEKSNVQRRADDMLNLRLGVLSSALDGGKRGGPRHEPPPPGGPKRGRPPGFDSEEITALFDPAVQDPFYYLVWSRTGDPLVKSATAPAGIPHPDRKAAGTMDRDSRLRSGVREVFLFTPPGECLLVGRSNREVDGALRGFALKTTCAGTGLLVFGLAVGWWISTRALRPIADISAAATRIAAGNLKERIRTGETDSELGKLATLLDETFQRLDASFEEQARFTSDAAHELRTPVSIILGQSQLALARERSGMEYRETIGISQRAAKRMHGLIESLLQLAVLDAEAVAGELIPCDLATVCREHLLEYDILISTDLSPAPCLAHAGQIGQILTNLVTNAVKFSPPGAEIHVITAHNNGAATLVVRDNGPGIAPQHLPHLFERFYRTDGSRNRASGGAGLGLAICKRIAETHGGTLTVASRVGVGSVFTLRIPRN